MPLTYPHSVPCAEYIFFQPRLIPPSPHGSETQCSENNFNAECPEHLIDILKNEIDILKDEIRGAHTFAGLDPLTALNSRRSALWESSGSWEPIDLKKAIFLQCKFAVSVKGRNPGVSGPTSEKHARDRGPRRGRARRG